MFLAGVDNESSKDYTYRREWIRQRLEKLASVFTIDVLTYAIRSRLSDISWFCGLAGQHA
jgi:hypothetical protein